MVLITTLLCYVNQLQHPFDIIEFSNGYGLQVPKFTIECPGVLVDQGKKKWGAPNYRTFVLKLGDIIDLNQAAKDRLDSFNSAVLDKIGE